MDILRNIRSGINFKFSFMKRAFGNRPFKLLDIGTGNHSASKTTKLFPVCEYYGVDLNRDYNNSEIDFKKMKEFYELDLTNLKYDIIPDNYFDGIWMSHVIEHLHNGDKVLPLLLKKLKKGGFFYIEYPGKKSTTLPSMRGTLNFKDDLTHVRLYSIPELKKIFQTNNCEVIASGTRRNWYYILAMPVRMLIDLIKRGHLEGNIFWDLLGFAEYWWVKKIN